MKHKYGEYSNNQIQQTKEHMRKQIFFLLLIVDPDTKDNYSGVNVDMAFQSLQFKLGGLNQLLNEPVELVTIMSLIESALNEYHNTNFCYSTYRKLILDAGAEVLRIKEV